MKRHIALFIGLVFAIAVGVSAVNFAKADSVQEILRTTNKHAVLTAGTSGAPALIEITDTTFALAGTGSTFGQFFRLVWLAGTTGYVGFSCGAYSSETLTLCLSATTQSATALTSPIFIGPNTDMIVDSGHRAPLIHVAASKGELIIRVEEVNRVK